VLAAYLDQNAFTTLWLPISRLCKTYQTACMACRFWYTRQRLRDEEACGVPRLGFVCSSKAKGSSSAQGSIALPAHVVYTCCNIGMRCPNRRRFVLRLPRHQGRITRWHTALAVLLLMCAARLLLLLLCCDGRSRSPCWAADRTHTMCS
jgi:hypothetical protein